MNIYIHIPFCKTHCCYCDFFSTINLNNRKEVVSSIVKEIKERVNKENIDNIYIGGGTPSLLSIEDIVEIFNSISKENIIKQDAEITFEANPDDLNKNYIHDIVSYTPINRISMGVQSFLLDDLKFLNRRHTDLEVEKAVEHLRLYGVNNISMDLIYGLPNQTKDKWEYNIKRMIALNPEHISAYHLTYEEGTPLFRKLKKGEVSEVDETDSIMFFYLLIDLLNTNGYNQYEISNFCKDGYPARLNSGYWNGSPYIGIGPSAHSFDGKQTRRINLPNIKTYINNVGISDKYYLLEHLTQKDIINEYMMTRLRTSKGINFEELRLIINDEKTYKNIRLNIDKYIASENIKIDNDRVTLTKKGMLISDKIISDLFIL